MVASFLPVDTFQGSNLPSYCFGLMEVDRNLGCVYLRFIQAFVLYYERIAPLLFDSLYKLLDGS